MTDVGHVPELEELYDERTMAAVDAGAGEPPGGPWRPRAARPRFGALIAGTVLGLQEVLDPKPEGDDVVELRPVVGDADDRWVTYLHVPGAPSLGRIVVRPWLAPAP